ncbi:Polyketide cyclase / dehydrase and lipid transport [Nonomuraea maritima]|uniref:Polyketide cyclase / dehydrase and lipid transport n=1 Tax=Nonomuraea maritima TaxID=683260 RepID=A0A1G9BUL6_9ACTN|nr:SRPBCC family protein [Nonomuraea maritima]SDK43151.1 Polyketide cyclase / dehydrase and lipid transport [Nonomuraea maritima]
MASVHKEIIIDADPAAVWAIISDFTDGPVRMAPGFVTDSRLDEPDVRVVTFADGTVVRERLIALDDELRRLVFSVIGGTMQPEHDNASMQVIPHGDGRSRFVWIHDVQPDDLTIPMGAGMGHGLNIFKQTVESSSEHLG